MWVKESVGAREFGWRREDNLGYVGRSAGKWWRAYVRPSVQDDFALLSAEGWVSDEGAKRDVDGWLAGREVAA